MIELHGKFNSAKVFTDEVDSSAIAQIIEMCNNEDLKNSQIRIMPDTHAGKGCTIGTTITIRDELVIPSMVGVDIGCGMLTVGIRDKNIDLRNLDSIIKKSVPCGYRRHSGRASTTELDSLLSSLNCIKGVNLASAYESIGTLGGGNHFIEIDKDGEGNLYLVIHTGSRHLGVDVEKYYTQEANRELSDQIKPIDIAVCKEMYSGKQLGNAITELKRSNTEKYKKLKGTAPCRGNLFRQYINDMKIAQRYAETNRREIAKAILTGANLTEDNTLIFDTIHNYIDTNSMILRKGAVSAQLGERILIPINMRDGSLVCIGKGNADWNYSAPHGAGRLMSRSKAKSNCSVSEFKLTMMAAGVYSTTVNSSTLDECPMAYKTMESIVSNIQDTAEVENIIRPIYNFKSGTDD